MKVGIFYGTNTGNTSDVVEVLESKLIDKGFEAIVNDLATSSVSDFDNYEFLILACPTWNDGELQDDFEEASSDLESYDFSGKTVALLGLGDQEVYADNFVDAIGILYDSITKQSAKVIGMWPTDGYEFDDSVAVREGKFVGLAIDEDNQTDQTDDRISQWIDQLVEEMK